MRGRIKGDPFPSTRGIAGGGQNISDSPGTKAALTLSTNPAHRATLATSAKCPSRRLRMSFSPTRRMSRTSLSSGSFFHILHSAFVLVVVEWSGYVRGDGAGTLIESVDGSGGGGGGRVGGRRVRRARRKVGDGRYVHDQVCLEYGAYESKRVAYGLRAPNMRNIVPGGYCPRSRSNSWPDLDLMRSSTPADSIPTYCTSLHRAFPISFHFTS